MLYGQKAGFKGSITDTTGKQPLHYAVIALISKADSTLINSIRSNTEGKFQLEKIKPGSYTVMLTYPEMADFLVDINLADTGILDIGKIVMTSRYHLLEEVTVRAGKAIRMRGDTLEYKADSFQVAPGANVEALLRRLPGIEIGPDGKIKAQGKIVNTVLVDGDEFFRDDPTLVTQYLKASSVDKVQVFDKKSVQAEFTGIDDGMSSKTMNITLKEDSKKGLFGKLSAGSNGDGFYSHEGMVNKFNRKEKMGVYGISSNTGRMGLGYEDRAKFLTNTQSRISIEDDDEIMYEMDFDEGYSSGIPTSTNVGSQYVNKWNKDKQSINLNYSYSRVQSTGWETHSGSQLLPDNSIRASKGNNNFFSLNNKHNAVAVYETKIDSFSIARISLNGQSGETSSASSNYEESKDGVGNFLNKSNQQVTQNGKQQSVAGNFIWQKRFRKIGRVASLYFEKDNQERTSTKLAETTNFFYSNNNPTADTLNQLQDNSGKTNKTSARLTFTEPISKKLLISSEYTWSSIASDRNRNVFGQSAMGKYDDPIDTLSNNYHFNIRSHIPGLTIQFKTKKVSISGGSKINFSELEQQNLDLKQTVIRRFNNYFPTARISLSLKEQSRIELQYNGNTRQPSIEQLQPLRDNSNPLYANIGNPNLRPSFDHSLSISFSKYDFKGNSLNLSASWQQTMNAFTSKQTVDQFNRSVTQYINRNNLPSGSFFLYFNKPLLKSNSTKSVNLGIHINGSSYGYLQILNDQEIITRQKGLSVGANLMYFKYNKLTLQYSFEVRFTASNANIGNIGATKMFTHNHTPKATIYLPWKIELETNANMQFQPANGSFGNARNIVKWNASLQKKFLKNDKAILNLSVFDILNQYTGFYRSINGNGFYESSNNYIPRYALLSFIWNFSTRL